MNTQKTNIFGIGMSGLVGSRISEQLADRYSFDNLSLDTGVDITNPQTLDKIRNDADHSAVLHLAALADVDACEKDQALAYKINVQGTRNVVEACASRNKKIIYISTDFVFDGKNPPVGGYTEEDTPNPINYYGQTKFEGEEVVRKSGLPYLILRITYPYRPGESPINVKPDFVHVIRDRLRNNQPTVGVVDQMITPTFIDDIASSIDLLLHTESIGTYHVVGDQSLSPYDAVMLIAKQFGCDESLITKTTNEEFNKGKAPRPFKLITNNAKIKRLGVQMRGFEEGLQELRTEN